MSSLHNDFTLPRQNWGSRDWHAHIGPSTQILWHTFTRDQREAIGTDAAKKQSANLPNDKCLKIRLNQDGSLDEIVARNAFSHIEKMDKNKWWFSIEQNGKQVDVWLEARGKITTHFEVSDDLLRNGASNQEISDIIAGPGIYENREGSKVYIKSHGIEGFWRDDSTILFWRNDGSCCEGPEKYDIIRRIGDLPEKRHG